MEKLKLYTITLMINNGITTLLHLTPKKPAQVSSTVRNREGEEVAEFLNTLKEAVLGKEVNLPICSLQGRKAIQNNE